MVIVQVIGGTASQMSAFSRGYTLAKKLNRELVLDISDYHNGYKFPYALDSFNVNVRKLTYTHASATPISSSVVPKDFIEKFAPYFIQTNTLTFDEIFLEASKCNSDCIYLVGEGGAVFEFITELKEIFTPRKKTTYLEKFKSNISTTISVAVHIRLTDFVMLNWNHSFDYYIAAINYMKLQYPNAIFYFFSDDLETVKQQFGEQEEYRYVNLFGGYDTDVDELLCMSMCSHRILTGRSGYSIWCAHLAASPDATNLTYSADGALGDHFFQPFTDAHIQQYLNTNFHKLETKRISNITKAKADILTLIENENHEGTLSLISSVSFDATNLLPADKEDFFSFCELIHSAQGNFLEAEQCLHRHIQFAFDSVDVNYNTAIVKWSLGKKLSSYIYASKACRLSSDQDLVAEFTSIFSNDEDGNLFHLLLQAPKMHFIICPICNFHFYMKHAVSLGVLLKRMGHEVSLMNRGIHEGFDPNTPMDTLIKYSLENPSIPDVSYNYNIEGYNYFQTDKFSSYIPLVEALIERADLPSIVIGHSPIVCEHLKYPKLLYWDFSCGLDIDSLAILQNYDINAVDSACCKNPKKAITTKKNRQSYLAKIIGTKNVMLSKPYIENAGEYTFIDEVEPFSSNFIDNAAFIRFAIDIVKLSETLV